MIPITVPLSISIATVYKNPGGQVCTSSFPLLYSYRQRAVNKIFHDLYEIINKKNKCMFFFQSYLEIIMQHQLLILSILRDQMRHKKR